MTSPKQTEPSVNNALGNLLRGMMPTCTVRSENTQTFPDYPGRHADVLVTATGRSPVTVEAEFEPAPEAEKDARERLGLRVQGEVRTIEASVAVRYPSSVETAYDVNSALNEAVLSYCVIYEDNSRFPEAGWLQGSVTDLADLVRLVSVPQREVDQAADILEAGIEAAASIMDRMAESRPAISSDIAGLLGMIDVAQTRRMACAILANALVFHERIAGMHEDVTTLLKLSSNRSVALQDAFIEAWTTVLDIDYYPIFSIAKDILTNLQSEDASQILQALLPTARQVNATGVDNAHDLTGRIFQRLIADRKYLATFYTRPASAALLARLAVAKLEGVDWGDAEALGNLRIGDFACGTGALLSAVYDQIAARHERAGGDVAKLHPVMMEEVLYGCDVMPSAVHITSSTLSGAHPNVDFHQSRLYTMPYGRQADGTVKIGSLELLQASEVQTLFNTSDPALRTGSLGEETAAQVNVDIPDESFDLAIMNPPFTRAGSDWEGTQRPEDYVKQFRGLSTDLDTQKAMASREKVLSEDTCAHGYAGIASTFAALANQKLKPGGVLALVLPLSAAAGMSWQRFRQMLSTDYRGIVVLSTAANGDEISFSSDTGMGECLVVCRKSMLREKVDDRIKFASLTRRPQNLAIAGVLATGILQTISQWAIEDGPYDGTHILSGDSLVGKSLTAGINGEGAPWSGSRILDYSVAQTAFALVGSKLWLPGISTKYDIKTVPLNSVGQRGYYHMNIAGNSSSAPFSKQAPSPTATYPALWNHNSKKETRMVCEPDTALQVIRGMTEKAEQVWSSASRCHINQDFRFNSQP